MNLSYATVKESCQKLKSRLDTPKNAHLIQKANRKTKQWVWILIRAVFIIGFCFVILYPVLTMISKSFMHQADIYDKSVIWIPKTLTLQNLQFAWSSAAVAADGVLSCLN